MYLNQLTQLKSCLETLTLYSIRRLLDSICLYPHYEGFLTFKVSLMTNLCFFHFQSPIAEFRNGDLGHPAPVDVESVFR